MNTRMRPLMAPSTNFSEKLRPTMSESAFVDRLVQQQGAVGDDGDGLGESAGDGVLIGLQRMTLHGHALVVPVFSLDDDVVGIADMDHRALRHHPGAALAHLEEALDE